MKSVAVLAGVVAVAAADSYGYGQESKPSSSAKVGYTTVYPGHGYEPVTVTAQYQPIPTYDAEGKSSEYLYVSTSIKGYDGKYTTITKTDQDVVIYSTKSTVTHYKTEPAQGYAQPTGAYPTGGYYPPTNGTKPSVKPYYELYEKIHEAKYKELGPKALPGYPGSDLYKGDKEKQHVKVKEYKGGKWVEYYHVFDYGVPKPSATTFQKPGTYTLPASTKTVHNYEAYPTEAKHTASAHEKFTYGKVDVTVTAKTTVTITIPHKTADKTSYETKTVTCPSAGKYEVQKPTTTSFDHKTTFTYPTVTVYPPGTYTHSKETVTVTKSNSPYTCTYGKPEEYPATKTSSTKGYDSYPTTVSKESYPTSSSSKGGDYGYPTTTTSGKYPDPSSDNYEPVEEYGTPYTGYVKRGGMLERRKAEPEVKKAAGKRVILV